MPASARATTRISEVEFLALPEGLERVELLDGEVVVPPSPSDEHQRVSSELHGHLGTRSRAHPPAAIRSAPLDIRFGEGRILQPDVALWLLGLPRGGPTPVSAVPDLCVEVLSWRRSYDRITKRHVYAEAGVSEYWVVDPEEAAIEVYRGLALDRTVRDELRSAVVPGFALDVSALFS